MWSPLCLRLTVWMPISRGMNLTVYLLAPRSCSWHCSVAPEGLVTDAAMFWRSMPARVMLSWHSEPTPVIPVIACSVCRSMRSVTRPDGSPPTFTVNGLPTPPNTQSYARPFTLQSQHAAMCPLTELSYNSPYHSVNNISVFGGTLNLAQPIMFQLP